MKYEELANLLTYSIHDKEAVNVFSRISEPPSDECAYEFRFYRNYKMSGISISFYQPTYQMDAVFLYSKGRDGFGKFQGTLPFGLEFGMPCASAIKKIGRDPIKHTRHPVEPDAEILKIHPVESREVLTYSLNSDLNCALTFFDEGNLGMVVLF